MLQPKFAKHLPAIALGVVALIVLASGSLMGHPAYSLSHIERADTSAARTLGLGGRAEIPGDYGMLFVFDTPDDYAFWMKDMLVPIDILWIRDDGTIAGIERSVATSTYPASFMPPEPVRYVLETKAGTADANGWTAGTMLSLPLR